MLHFEDRSKSNLKSFEILVIKGCFYGNKAKFTGSPCCSVSYYKYMSIRPYYIVVHFCK